MRAGNTLDALKQWRKLVGDDSLAMKNLKMIIVGRLVRRLCSACKVGYTPDPNTLKKLNMNPDVVGKLYQARKEPMRDAKGNAVPCTFCNDLAFKGRFGIYEVMIIDDEIRNVIKAGGADTQIKQAQRKQRSRFAAGSGAGAGAGRRDKRRGSAAGAEARFGIGRLNIITVAGQFSARAAKRFASARRRRHRRAARLLQPQRAGAQPSPGKPDPKSVQ